MKDKNKNTTLLNKSPGRTWDFPFLNGSTILQYLSCWLILFGLATSCSNTKFLAEDEKLYTYTWFSEQGLKKVNNKPLKVYELYLVGKVKTNRPAVMLPRMNLGIYNYWRPSGNWGPRHYIYKVFAKPPVLLETVNPEFRAKVMEQKLVEMGHFDSRVTAEVKEYGKDSKKARAKYNIFFRSAYTYRNVEYFKQQTLADSIIDVSMAESLILSGKEYWLKDLQDERKRLTLILKNRGLYFFNPDFLLFHADTTVGEKQVDLTLLIKDQIPEKVYNPYTLRNVTITIKSGNKRKIRYSEENPVLSNGCLYDSSEDIYRPHVITRPISLKQGDLYTFTAHENTLRYLQGMEMFRSVDIIFKESDSASAQLDASIELIPLKPLQTSLEANFSTKSNDFLGPAAIATLGHRNVFKGGEQLSLQLDGGFEWQRRSKTRRYELGINSYEIGSQIKLTIPRFLAPFRLENQSKRYVPKSYASIGLRSLKRVQYYTMNLSQAKFGYAWRTSPRREYKIEPLSFDYLRLTETSTDFDQFLVEYPQVAKSFEEQFIIGSIFSYTYTNNPKNKKQNHYYYNGTLDLAGNLLNAVYIAGGLKESGTSETGTILGTTYSQYTRITNDFRYYLYITEKRQIALRFLAGIGIPYGNSTVLPYVKQYFAGGSQDIRAFYARSIGPGSYQSADSLQGSGFLDQSGEIKLMANAEYRFPITYKAYGAFFVDAGNVWLLKDDESRPGGKFSFNNFLDEIAIGSGFGLRIDIGYLVIRLDAGIPISKPYLKGSEKWIFNNASFFKDYILSLAVGYPF